MSTTDPIDAYIATLDDRLHGPAPAKARLVGEIREGLSETVAALSHQSLPYPLAVRQAVQEFGEAEDLIADCQRELSIAQARHTAALLALTAPFLIGCWYLVQHAGAVQDSQIARTAGILVTQLATVAGAAVLLAAAALVATGSPARWLPTLERLPLAVAWTATTASLSMAVATLALATASALAENWTLTGAACALAGLSHAVVAGSARACRRCAHAPTRTPLAL